MIQKKVCMLGTFAVGKTSLVSRFVKSLFSDKYLSSVGVKVDKKVVAVGSEQVNLLLWDIYGEDDFQKMRPSYLRGSAGYVLVVDGTRSETLEKGIILQNKTEELIGKVPFVLVVNKVDLVEKWELDDSAIAALGKRGWPAFKTSAKTGEGVEAAFLTLAGKMLEPSS